MIVVLHPDAPQRLDSGDMAQPRWCGGRGHSGEQQGAIRTDGQRACGTRVRARRQTIVFSTPRVALDPGWGAESTQPVRRDDSQVVESVAQCLADEFDAVEGAHGGQDMRRVGALTSPGTQEFVLTTPGQERVEQEGFGRSFDQTTPELAQDGAIKAGIGQLQSRDILPVDTTAQRMGRLQVGESLGELEDGHQSQAPGSQSRLALGREERGERIVSEQDAALISQA